MMDCPRCKKTLDSIGFAQQVTSTKSGLIKYSDRDLYEINHLEKRYEEEYSVYCPKCGYDLEFDVDIHFDEHNKITLTSYTDQQQMMEAL